MTSSRLRAACVALACSAISLGAAASAQADTVFTPTVPNGQKVYLSQACHDRGGPACVPNSGCFGYNENAGSAAIARSALHNVLGGGGLLERGYTVNIGDGLTDDNISNSNAWGSTMHIPIHSNAGGEELKCTAPFTATDGGTQTMYVSTSGQELAEQLLAVIGPRSPGTSDTTVERTDLGELNDTNMPAAYLEAAFHTYGPDTNWLNDPTSWSWGIGAGVDACRGYPRAGVITLPKKCTW
jgi:N-acetylmuramoyl-L-alanine amidase